MSDDERTTQEFPATFAEVFALRLSRRRVVLGGLGAVLAAACSESSESTGTGANDVTPPSPAPTGAGTNTTPAPGPTTPPADQPDAAPKPLVLGFTAVARSLADAIVVPAGYAATVLYRLGDPIAVGIGNAANDGTDTGASFAQRAGDHHDGMHYFGLGSNGKLDSNKTDRALLVMNHEALTPAYLHTTGPTIAGSGANAVRTASDEVVKEMNAQGVSVIEIAKTSGKWAPTGAGSARRRRACSGSRPTTAPTPMSPTA
jgi:hypothetical protein